MPATAALFGGGLGLFVQFYSNAVRKLPLMHHPWEHAIAGGIGAYSATWLVAWEERTVPEVEEMLKKRAERNSRIPSSSD
jgi:hypothetical protein